MPILGGCCCFDLKVGTTIIAVIHLLSAIAGSISYAIFLFVITFFSIGIDKVKEENSLEETLKSIGTDSFDPDTLDYFDTTINNDETWEIIKKHIDTATIICYVLLGLSILKIITTSMALSGIRNERRGMLLPFIIQESINILAVLTIMIILSVLFGATKLTGIICASFLIGIAISIYFILVIVSQFQALGLIRMHEEISMK